MSAKDMFEKLGYKQYIEASNVIEVISCDKQIRFNKDGKYKKTIEIFTNTDDYKYDDYTYAELTHKELKAINKQIEELGWNK